MSKEEIKLNSIWHKISSRFSEKVYLLFVSLLFLLIASLIGIDMWYKPIFSMDHDLAINLFADLIIAALTVFLLSLFVLLRQEREWHTVKDDVWFMLRMELSMLFDEILEITDGGLDFKIRLASEDNKQKKRELLLQKLQKLRDEEATLNNYSVKSLLTNKKSLEGFMDISKRLSNLELKYSRHLPAEAIFCIVRLQMGIESLEYFSRLNSYVEEIPEVPQDLITSKLKPIISGAIDSVAPPYLLGFIRGMMVYVLKLYHLGFEFDYPPV